MRCRILIPLLLAVAACDSANPPTTLLQEWQQGLLDAERAVALLRGGEPMQAQAAFQSAFDRSLLVLRGLEGGAAAGPDARRLPDVANVKVRLAELSIQLGRMDPAEFRRGARIASQIADEAPSLPASWGVLGTVFLEAGAWVRAADCLERYLSLARPEKVVRAHIDLSRAHHELALRELRTGGLRGPAKARKHLTRALELLGEDHRDPTLQMSLEALNLQYAGEANPVVDRGDDLELARIHSRYGFLDLCKQKLDEVVRERTVVGEVRWVVARYWYEPNGTREMLENADEAYADLLKDGTPKDEVVAARIRVRRRLGLGKSALEKYGELEAPAPEVRLELIRTWLDHAARREENDLPGWREDARRIEKLMAGEIPDHQRADLLIEAGFQSVRFRDRDHLERIVERFRKTWPKDRRVLLLEAGLDGLRDVPLLPDESSKGAATPGETR